MIWVYAVTERAEPGLPRVAGVAGAPLEAIAEGPLVAVGSRHEHVPDAPALDALQAHERVVEALMTDRAVLPMRFATRLPGPDQVQAALAERRESLLDALDRVRGRVELAVRAIQPPADAASGSAAEAASGTEYLRARLRIAQSRASLHEPLAALAVDARRWPEHAPGALLRASYLVDQPAVARFRRTVEQLQREHPEAALLCTGPWPPYSFTEPAGR